MFDDLKKYINNITDDVADDLVKEIAMVEALDQFVDQQNPGTYYVNYHKVHVSENNNAVETLIILIHECMHALVGETFYGYFLGDLSIFMDLMIHFQTVKKTELFQKYFERLGINSSKKIQSYISDNVLELDIMLSQNKGFVNYLWKIMRLYVTINGIHENSLVLNEGFATYISINMSSERFSYLFPQFSLFLQDKTLGTAIKHFQKSEYQRLMSLNKDSPYVVGYSLADQIAKKFGDEGLLLSVVAATNLPYFNYDLFSCSDDELKRLLHTIYNCDYRWKNFLNLDTDYVGQAVLDPTKYMKEICATISTVQDIPLPITEYKNALEYMYHYGYCNPTYISWHSLLGKDYADLYSGIIFDAKDTVTNQLKGPNMHRISTYDYFLERSAELVRDAVSDFFVSDGKTDNIATIQANEEMFQKRTRQKKAINTIAFILRYAEVIQSNNKLSSIINSNDTLSDAEIDYIRSLITRR